MPVERFLAKRIPEKNVAVGFRVVPGSGKHPVKTIESRQIPLADRRYDDFGVGLCTKSMTQLLELCPEFDIVVDLPVEDEHSALVVHEWLVRGCRQIDDSESSMTEIDIPSGPFTLIIRSAVGHRCGSRPGRVHLLLGQLPAM